MRTSTRLPLISDRKEFPLWQEEGIQRRREALYNPLWSRSGSGWRWCGCEIWGRFTLTTTKKKYLSLSRFSVGLERWRFRDLHLPGRRMLPGMLTRNLIRRNGIKNSVEKEKLWLCLGFDEWNGISPGWTRPERDGASWGKWSRAELDKGSAEILVFSMFLDKELLALQIWDVYAGIQVMVTWTLLSSFQFINNATTKTSTTLSQLLVINQLHFSSWPHETFRFKCHSLFHFNVRSRTNNSSRFLDPFLSLLCTKTHQPEKALAKMCPH